VSLPAVLARIAEIQSALAPPTVAPTPAVPPASGTSTATASPFSTALAQAGGATRAFASTAVAPVPAGSSAGQAIVDIARREIGVREQPPGSNDAPRIARYRQATAGSGVGPWCAYFASWAARQAGVPLGDSGQGFGRVDDVWAWAERSGKAIPAGSGTPHPGDLVVWDEHIGIVESVGADGSVTTIEGNSSDQVAERHYGADANGAVGFVRLG
jgi:CHAP domain